MGFINVHSKQFNRLTLYTINCFFDHLRTANSEFVPFTSHIF